ncbi:Lipase 2 [Colletotrichum trifolii]|uniref:Carboxylic ester hydrolase n=1 Tax=Colletotrichum trifolii TaxID=5466 RepID=A0A4R8RQ42_COLTR|nr:Lipase 2 [Colletotrichum trifolii]
MKSQLILSAALPILASAANPVGPTVELPYGRYEGVHNSTTNLNIFRGIRYAAPPIGNLRWQPPQPPRPSNASITPAVDDPPHCPWARRSLLYPKTAAEEASLDKFDLAGDEDCLFLNVFAPADAKDLPVLVWIHGGGYGLDGAGSFDFSTQIGTNNNTYVAVAIQYRLGAFGFLSSADVAADGVANAGLHDMLFALRWVQKHISEFGGDATRVTVGGQSAGAGAALLMATMDGADELFTGVIASSPYITTQPEFDDARPTALYQSLAERVGCAPSRNSSSLLTCLRQADSTALQNASDWVSTRGRYGHWAWGPVTDGKLIKDAPAAQLSKGVRGFRVLTSNVADEGPYFTPQNITSRADFVSFLRVNYPRLSEPNVTEILAVYSQKHEALLAASSRDANNTDPGFSTNGVRAPFATTMSNYAAGWQQVANNLYAEATFVCPSQWLADAYAAKQGGKAWRYQFSVPPAYHGSDVGSGTNFDVLLAPVTTPGTSVTQPVRRGLQTAWGDFIVAGAPTLRGAGSDETKTTSSYWPQWKRPGGGGASMLNVNMTGGVATEKQASFDGMVSLQITSYVPGGAGDEPLEAVLEVVDGDAWEDGRGERCRVLASLSPWISG